MKTVIKKSIVGIITLTTMVLVSGSGVFAQDNGPGDVNPDADLAFIQSEATGTVTEVANRTAKGPGGLITYADYAFAAQPYAETAGTRQAAFEKPQTVGIITAVGYQFVTEGHARDVFAVQDDLAESLAGNQAQ